MKKKVESPFYIALLFVVMLLGASVLSRLSLQGKAAEQTGIRPPLVLEPKATLKTMPGSWAFAPEVPPPIQRKEQRRLVVNWEVKETQAEIAPGVTYDDYWGFEGRVPGPILRVREGDLVEVHLKNNLSSIRPHNIDFHFVSGPGGGASALNVAPGETAVLEARALAPGLYMFHCATPDIPTHVANGMYGYVLVEPAEGLPRVDREWYVVQSEIYTKNGEPGHQAFSMERGEKADAQYVVFNGAVGAMMGEKTLRAAVGESIRLYLGNAGPNYVSSFHVIGQIFDKVYREGDLISPPGQSVQTTPIPAGGSAVVEFTARVPGTFLLVDHAIFRLHQGAVGGISVSGEQAAEIFEPKSSGFQSAMSDHGHSGPIPPANTAVVKAKTAATPASPQPAGLSAPAPTPAPATSAAAPSATIEILAGAGNFDKNPTNDYFPANLVIKRGTTVTWINKDGAMVHDVMAVRGEFRSVLLRPHQSFSHTFDKPGVYRYTCAPHPWMKGKIVVR